MLLLKIGMHFFAKKKNTKNNTEREKEMFLLKINFIQFYTNFKKYTQQPNKRF